MIYPRKNSLPKSIKRAERSALTNKSARDSEVQHIPQELFESTNRAQLLRYLADHESSRVFEVVINALRKEALLLEPSAISLQVLGRLAFRLDNRVDFYAQLLETANAVIVECVQDSRAGRDSGFSIPGEVQLLGSRDRAQEACRRFNCLPDHERKIVYAVLIQRATRESVAIEHNISSLLLEEIVNRCISNVCGSPPDSAPIAESQL